MIHWNLILLCGSGVTIVIIMTQSSSWVKSEKVAEEGYLPTLQNIHKIPGYEDISFEYGVISPPEDHTYLPSSQGFTHAGNIPNMTAEKVKEELSKYVDRHYCFSKSFSKRIVLQSIEPDFNYYYTLESFMEKREVRWAWQPSDTCVDNSVSVKIVPKPWDVEVIPLVKFLDDSYITEIPNSSTTLMCSYCKGFGYSECEHDANKTCLDCKDHKGCATCPSCPVCSGSYKIQCPTCRGKGNIRYFLELRVTWNNYIEDVKSEKSLLPQHVLNTVLGQIAYEEENVRVNPITHFENPHINQTSYQSIQKHATTYKDEFTLCQRQNLRIVPVYRITYTHNRHADYFFIYGYNNQVYFDEYPRKYWASLEDFRCSIS